METELFLLLLNKEFYEKNKHRIVKTFFPDELVELYETLVRAHEKYSCNVSLKELKALHFLQNSALSKTAKDNYEYIFSKLEKLELPNQEIAHSLIEGLWKQEVARQVANEAIKIINGKSDDLNALIKLTQAIQEQKGPSDDYEPVTTDISKLLEIVPRDGRWQFNIPDLKTAVSGLNPGSLVIVPARPETGKTALWVNLAAGPHGFVAQGASVHAIVNEEPGERTLLRAINSYTGIRTSELYVRSEEAAASARPLLQSLRVIDKVGMTVEELDAYAARHRPDILVVDQLDKLGITRSFARTDEKLRAIYTGAREIAKRNSLVLFAISQASAMAEGKLFITMDMLENSRTGKAAEADLILAIGRRNLETGADDPARTIYVPKNKINGWHGSIHCVLDGALTRFS